MPYLPYPHSAIYCRLGYCRSISGFGPGYKLGSLSSVQQQALLPMFASAFVAMLAFLTMLASSLVESRSQGLGFVIIIICLLFIHFFFNPALMFSAMFNTFVAKKTSDYYWSVLNLQRRKTLSCSNTWLPSTTPPSTLPSPLFWYVSFFLNLQREERF